MNWCWGFSRWKSSRWKSSRWKSSRRKSSGLKCLLWKSLRLKSPWGKSPWGKSRPWYVSPRRLCVSVRRRFLHDEFIEKVRVHVSRLLVLYDSNLFFFQKLEKLKKYIDYSVLSLLSSLSSSEHKTHCFTVSRFHFSLDFLIF